MIRGVGIASLICCLFGCIWIALGVSLVDTGQARVVWNALLGFGVLMLISSVLFIARPGDDGKSNRDWGGVAKKLRIVNGIQWSIIVIIIIIANILRHTAPLPWVISVIVGIHFLPLGYILRLRSYKVLGGAIIVLDLAALTLSPNQRYGYAALGTGLSLLCVTLYWIVRAFPTWLRRPWGVDKVRSLGEN